MIAFARLVLALSFLQVFVASDLCAQTPAIRWQRHAWTEEGIFAADLSPDGRWLALGFNDGLVRVVPSANPEEARVLPTPYTVGGSSGAVTGLAFSPTGDSLVTLEHPAGVFLWDLRADTVIRRIATRTGLYVPSTVAFDGRTITVANGDFVDRMSLEGGAGASFSPGGVISPSGRFLLSTRRDSSDSAVAVVVDLENPGAARVLARLADDRLVSVAFSEDERLVAYAELRFRGEFLSRVLIFDIVSGSLVDSVSIPVGSAIALSSNGDSLLIRLLDRVLVRDRARGTVDSIALGHRGNWIEPSTIGFLPGGRIWVAEAHREGAPYVVSIPSLNVIELAGGVVVAHVTGSFGSRSARITPDGREVVATDGSNASRWTVDRGRLVDVPSYDADKRCYLSIDGEFASMLRWHSESSVTQRLSYEGTRRADVSSVIHSYVTNYRIGLPAPGGRFHLGNGTEWDALWDVEKQSSTRLPELEGAVGFSFDGSMLAASRRDGILVIYNTMTSEVIRHITDVDPASRIMFSRDGALIASYRSDGNVQIVDVGNGVAGRIVQTLDAGMNDHIFDHRGRFLLTASSDGSVSVWDLNDDTRVDRFDVGASVLSVDVSPDGGSIATVDGEGTLTVWEAPGPIAAIEPTLAQGLGQSGIDVVHTGAFGLHARIVSLDGEATLSLIDALGRVRQRQIVRRSASMPVSVGLSAVEPGWYLLVLARGGETIATRVIVVD